MNTPGLRQVREKVRNLLEDAEQKRNTSLQDAMVILQEAAQLLPQLAVEKSRGSVRNLTEDRKTNEISYMSKRGNILYELKDYEEAQKCYEFIRKKLPNNTGVHKALGDCLRKLKKFKGASEMYDRGLVVYEKDDLVAPSVKASLLNSRGLNDMEQGKYAEAKIDFEAAVKMTTKNPNPLYLYNKGYALYALNEKDEALKWFIEANELAKSSKTNGLTEQNLEYIKNSFDRLVKGLKNLKTVELKSLDQGIHARELGYIKANFDAIDLTEVEEQGEKVPGQEGVSIIMAAKLDVKRIQQDQPLFEYYDGFLFALSKSYNTAVIINSGQELFHTNTSREMDILASAIQLMPLVGTGLCDNLEDLAKYIKGPEVMKAAANICKFATSQSTFLGIVQDALVEAIDAKQEEIKAQKEIDLEKIILPKLASKYQKIINRINKLKGNGSEMLYGERNETPLQRLGYMTANTLMSEYVASGAIYNGEQAIRISKDEKKKRLTQIAKDLFDKSLDRTQQPHQPQQTVFLDNTESRGSCNNCQGCRMF